MLGVIYDGLVIFFVIFDGWMLIYDNLVVLIIIDWMYNSGVVFNNIDYNFFDFCVEGIIIIDFIFIVINWLNQDLVICIDIIGVYCFYCFIVSDDQFYCDDDGDYVYQFSFVNYFLYNVNVIVLEDVSGFLGVVGNSGVYMLVIIVLLGGIYIGSILVQLNGMLGEEVCFDIIF